VKGGFVGAIAIGDRKANEIEILGQRYKKRNI